MANLYEKAIYEELGPEITQQLKDGNCKFVVSHKSLKFTFLDCPMALINQILEVKKAKGEQSILNEYVHSDI
jgi:hypothetical protein